MLRRGQSEWIAGLVEMAKFYAGAWMVRCKIEEKTSFKKKKEDEDCYCVDFRVPLMDSVEAVASGLSRRGVASGLRARRSIAPAIDRYFIAHWRPRCACGDRPMGNGEIQHLSRARQGVGL